MCDDFVKNSTIIQYMYLINTTKLTSRILAQGTPPQHHSSNCISNLEPPYSDYRVGNATTSAIGVPIQKYIRKYREFCEQMRKYRQNCVNIYEII